MSQPMPEAANVVQLPREISGAATPEDQLVESSLRPRTLEEYVGQPKITTNLKIFLRAAKVVRLPLEISGAARPEDQLVESSFRPRTLKEYVGQPKITTNLKIFLRAARARRESLD